MEDRLIFDARYQLEVPQIDREHQKLFELADKIYDSLAVDVIVPMQEIRQALGELVESTRVHFANEEALMATTGYPGLQEHKVLHAQLITNITELGTNELAERFTPVDLYQFLCSWLGDHIEEHDRQFADFFAQSELEHPAF